MTLKNIKVPVGKLMLALLILLSTGHAIAQKKTAKNPPKGNPFIRDMYTADPSAHVWADGRLYVYASHDIFPARGCDLMDQYHVFRPAT
jgi:hypothetical protein